MTKRKILAVCLLAACVALGGCSVLEQPAQEEEGAPAQMAREPVKKVETVDINSLPLKDDASLYTAYDPVEPVCFYVTVVGGSEADGTNHTLAEVDSYLNLQGMTGVEKIKSEIIFQVGDETGPLPGEVGFGAVASNATINVRGRTSTGYPQKSYRIDLFDTAGLWRGQRAIALNKHPADPTRLRNMLYFRLLQDVPGMVSLRTQFVHLYVRDETDPEAPDGYADYGLYTQVELPNGRYLRNHGLSRDGALYKANMCELYRYEDALKLVTDPTYDEEAFNAVLEPKTTNDHTKLLQMLDAVNDMNIPIEQVVETYFSLDNLTSYVAYNLLMANPDSNAQNYLLYSPVNSDTWYYICWDGDGALALYQNTLLDAQWTEGEWCYGISNYWGVKLFNRMLRVPEYREALRQKVELLHGIITPERINGLIAQYRTTVDRFTTAMPDAVNMRIPTEKLELVYQNMAYDTDVAYERVMASFDKPMPFFMADVTAQNDDLLLTWEASYDFAGEFVRYDVQVATDWTFAEGTVVYESTGQLDTQAQLPLPAPGAYYWRVTATNESGQTQVAFDQTETASGIHHGMRRFLILQSGKVVNPT